MKDKILIFLKTIYPKMKYVFWLIAAVLAVFVVHFVHSLFSSPKDPPHPAPVIVQTKMQVKVDQAQEQALIAETKATFKADEDIQKLNDVLVIDDGVERRKRLAAMLNGQ